MLVVSVIILIAVILGFSGYNRFLDLENKKTLFQAVDNCNAASSFESQASGGAKAKAPIRDVFVKCMQDKGLKVE